jgi:predicted transposase YbfD/YdcC
VVSIEAMGCQKALAQTIVEAKADYVLALKDNHKERCEAGSRYFCESLFWASQPKQAAKITRPLLPAAPQPSCSRR